MTAALGPEMVVVPAGDDSQLDAFAALVAELPGGGHLRDVWRTEPLEIVAIDAFDLDGAINWTYVHAFGGVYCEALDWGDSDESRWTAFEWAPAVLCMPVLAAEMVIAEAMRHAEGNDEDLQWGRLELSAESYPHLARLDAVSVAHLVLAARLRVAHRPSRQQLTTAVVAADEMAAMCARVGVPAAAALQLSPRAAGWDATDLEAILRCTHTP